MFEMKTVQSDGGYKYFIVFHSSKATAVFLN